MQHSIFEPLYSLQAPTMEACSLQAAAPHEPALSSFTSQAAAPSLFSISPPSSLAPRAPSTACSHRNDDHKCDDDGSIASKLLSSITKSISSPSLHLKSCKEGARESPYQKTLKLKHMKLHHCAEALGMESSDNSLFSYDSQLCIHQEKIDMIGNPNYSCPPSCTLPNSLQESSLKTVKSAPNLSSAPSLMTINHARYNRSTSFPPPLSHTLPTSSSYDSLSLSLRAYREDGRFILKETMVPSKHYFHAYRRNGRLTLHVITREDSEDENFGSQGDDEELSYKDSERRNLVEVDDEEESLECNMVSLDEETMEKSLQRLNCIAIHNNKSLDSADDDIISNVITLSLQTSSHSKVTLHKAQVLSFPHLSSYPLVSSSFKPSSLLHSADGFLSSKHDMSTFPQTINENFVWESNLMPRACAVASRGPRTPRKGGSGDGAAGAPSFIMEDMRAKSLMKVVSELATSLHLEASYGRGNWWLAGKKKPAMEGGESGTITGGNASEEGQISDGAKFSCNTSEGGNIKELNITTSPLTLDLQFPSSNLQSEEWLHTLHCKELFDRHQLVGQGFMKLQCIPTRS